MNAAHAELHAGDTDRQHDESNGNRHTLGAGVEESLTKSEQQTHDEAERQGENDLKQGLQNDREHIDGGLAH